MIGKSQIDDIKVSVRALEKLLDSNGKGSPNEISLDMLLDFIDVAESLNIRMKAAIFLCYFCDKDSFSSADVQDYLRIEGAKFQMIDLFRRGSGPTYRQLVLRVGNQRGQSGNLGLYKLSRKGKSVAGKLKRVLEGIHSAH